MQHQPGKRAGRSGGIKRIAQNRVTDFRHVHPQLMAASGQRHQPDAAFIILRPDHPPHGDGRPPGFVVHMLARAVRPVYRQGQIDAAYRREGPSVTVLDLSDCAALPWAEQAGVVFEGNGQC